MCVFTSVFADADMSHDQEYSHTFPALLVTQLPADKGLNLFRRQTQVAVSVRAIAVVRAAKLASPVDDDDESVGQNLYRVAHGSFSDEWFDV